MDLYTICRDGDKSYSSCELDDPGTRQNWCSTGERAWSTTGPSVEGVGAFHEWHSFLYEWEQYYREDHTGRYEARREPSACRDRSSWRLYGGPEWSLATYFNQGWAIISLTPWRPSRWSASHTSLRIMYSRESILLDEVDALGGAIRQHVFREHKVLLPLLDLRIATYFVDIPSCTCPGACRRRMAGSQQAFQTWSHPETTSRTRHERSLEPIPPLHSPWSPRPRRRCSRAYRRPNEPILVGDVFSSNWPERLLLERAGG